MIDSEPEFNLAPMPKIGKRIKRVRKSVNGRTAAEFGRLLGVSRQAVTNWELGKGVSRQNLDKISKFFNIPVGWLMNGPDDGPIPFLDINSASAPAEIARVASGPDFTFEEAVELLTAVFQSIGQSDSPETRVEARIVARAVIRAFRTPPTHPRSSLSESEKLSQVSEAIRLFRSE